MKKILNKSIANRPLKKKLIRLKEVLRDEGWIIAIKKSFLFLYRKSFSENRLFQNIKENLRKILRKTWFFCGHGIYKPNPPEFSHFLRTICAEPDDQAIPEYMEVLSDQFCATLRRLINQNQLETLRFIFNIHHYGQLNTDVVRVFPIIFRHYATIGWKEHRIASKYCSTAAYLNYMEKHGIPVKCNPLFHFIEQGADFNLLQRIEDQNLQDDIRRREYYKKYFDQDFYWADNPDVREFFIDPVTHYNMVGHREFRDPGPMFSNSEYLFFQRSLGRLVENAPLSDFADHGGSAELLNQAHCYFEQAFQQGMQKLSVTQMTLSELQSEASNSGDVHGKIAVHLHLYYYDLLSEMLQYLNCISQQFDLFVSIPQNSKCRIPDLDKIFHSGIARLQRLKIIRTPNVGRDIAPMIINFGMELLKYDYICHIHTKKSSHGTIATEQWRNSILNKLMGSPSVVQKILHLLENGTAKIIYPAPSFGIHYDSTGWAGNFSIAKELAAKYWKMDLAEFPIIDFSKGSMFWARSSAIRKILTLPLTYHDFPSEPIPTDGTLAHAIERLLLVSAWKEKGQSVCLRNSSDGLDQNFRRKKAIATKPFWKKLLPSDFPYSLNIASSAWLKAFPAIPNIPQCPVADIVVPVYNGVKHLQRLLKSLAKNTAPQCRIIFADDASPDPEVLPLLKDFCSQRPGTLLIQNEQNLGFLSTVNRAVSLCQHDFVLLNIDTEVPEQWIERLMSHLLSSKDIATVTPFSNAGTILSFPEKDNNNRNWANLFETEEIDKVMRFMKLPFRCNIPVGVGFCMAIRKKVWDEIGPFDAETYGRGYGEEVDWCLRASRAGYRHVLADNLYISHFHGGSFSSDEKKKLCESHQKILEQRYPEFVPLLQQFDQINCGILRLYRISALMRLLKMRNIPLVLILDHPWGGGATHFIHKRIKSLTKEGQIVCCCRPHGFQQIKAEISCGEDSMAFVCDSLSLFFSPDSPRVISIEINSLATWNLTAGNFSSSPKFLKDFFDKVAEWKRQTNFDITYYMHDFLPICPLYNLINNITKRYCEPDATGQKCSECLSRVHPFIDCQPLPGCNIKLWRKYFLDFLSNEVSRIICFSDNTVETLQKVWDQTEFLKKITMRPHQALAHFSPVIIKNQTKPIIAVVGTLTMIKGAEIVLDFANMIEKNKLPVSLVIIGEAPEIKFPKSVIVHGAFQHDDLPALITHYKINIAWIASIWPETFSFIRQELCQMDIPTACFNLGAPRDYIRQWDRGAIIPEISAQCVYNTLLTLFKKVYKR